ncbi:MAG: hypothetical protein U0575_00155 [Phycisphaerales bacterium]
MSSTKLAPLLLTVSLGLIAIGVGRLSASPIPADDAAGDGGLASIGNDVIVSALPSFWKFGTVNGITAYSIGTTSCNVGDVPLDWVDDTNQHPVIAQNLYRLRDGRFEQIGLSWVKHGFCAEQLSGQCGVCMPLGGGGCWSQLGIGCFDPYDALVNGLQFYLGPRSQVNASTGYFPYPFTAPPAEATIGRRLQVRNDDLNPALNPGATFFGEGLYVHPDDAADGNANNNATYRQAMVGAIGGGGYPLTMTGATFVQQPAIYAWQAADPMVAIVNVDVEGDGRFVVGTRVSDNGDGTWHYEYAVMNFNSDRSARSFSVPRGAGAAISNVAFRDIAYHSGEPYASDDWNSSVAPGDVTWSTATYAENANANALRWGTLYNFRFDAASPPMTATIAIGLFKPGAGDAPDTVSFVGRAPSPVCASPADLDCNGVVDGADLGLMLGAWGTDIADLNGDGTTDGADLGVLLGAWG